MITEFKSALNIYIKMSHLLNQDYINHLFEAGIIKEKEKTTYTQRIKNYQTMVENYYKELKEKQIQQTEKKQTEKQNEQIENNKSLSGENSIKLQKRKPNNIIEKSDDVVSNILSQ